MTADANPGNNPADNPQGPEGPRDRDGEEQGMPPPDSVPEETHGAHGRYGIEEETRERPSAADAPSPRKDPDEIARDAARDAEVKNTGEDLG